MQIFLSYGRADRARTRELAAALQSAGYSVWWDDHIPAGADYAAVLDEKIRAAKCIVVLWSSDAVRSQWVRDEAEMGRKLGNLIPVSIDGSEPPMGFKALETLDLRDWPRGAEESWARLLDRVAQLVERKPDDPPAHPARATLAFATLPKRSNCELAGYVALLLVAVMAVVVFVLSLILVVATPGLATQETMSASFLGTGLPRQIGAVITVYLASVFPLAMLYVMVCPQARREALHLLHRPLPR